MSIAQRERDRLIFEQAKEMRDHPKKAESKMMQILKQSAPKFPYIFQYVELPYTLDFYFQTLNICIEVDGKDHFARRKRDIKRDTFLLEMKGIVTYRFTNSDVLYNPQMGTQVSEILESLEDDSNQQWQYCPRCGAERQSNFLFCGQCGRSLT
jgi:very-short-patch-repair endonuclease